MHRRTDRGGRALRALVALVVIQHACLVAQPPATAVSAGYHHSLRIGSGGSLHTWGYNGSGELGTCGAPLQSVVPIPVTMLPNVVQASAGREFTVAVDSAGIAWLTGRIWGVPFMPSDVPVAVLSQVSSAHAGVDSVLFLKPNATVWAWGANGLGQLGIGAIGSTMPAPQPIPNLSNIAEVALGGVHGLYLTSNGTVLAAGWNGSNVGALGTGGTPLMSPTPIPVTGLTGVIHVAAGPSHSLALLGNGTVVSWGDNSSGQLGDGSTTDSNLPIPVIGLNGIVAIDTDSLGSHCLALDATGVVWAWGSNSAGQLGIGSTLSSLVPVRVPGLGGIATIDAGYNNSLAVNATGTVWAWGSPLLGTGWNNGSLIPIPQGPGPRAIPVGCPCGPPGTFPRILSYWLWNSSTGTHTFSFSVPPQGTNPTYLFVTVGPTVAPLAIGGGCELHLDLVAMLQLVNAGLLPIAQNWFLAAPEFPFTITNSPALTGVILSMQAAVLHPSLPGTPFSLTNALEINL